jgi:phosphate-selective porin OprO/OprP
MYAFDAGLNFESLFVGGEYARFDIDRVSTITTNSRSSGGPVPAGCTGTDPTHFTCAHAADHPQFSGWYLEASYFLTGETRSYSPSALNNEVGGWEGPSAVASPFSLDGDSWGTWEVAARYSSTDLNWNQFRAASSATLSPQAGVAGGRETVIDLGLNWYLNKDIRLMLA